MKHLKYLKSVLRHKYFVMQECFKHGLYWRGIKHDWSKFLPAEWIPYANYFYGRKPTRNKDGTLIPDPHFDAAWNHHQKFNDHHWQYWLLTRDSGETICLEMPLVCVREMICDWIGAGKAYGNPRTWEWYEQNKERIQLHKYTRAFVEIEMYKLHRNWLRDGNGNDATRTK